jgi:acetyl-CoA carboxylase biotin carboxylase subunit
VVRRVLVANRGEIAVRIVRACRDLGVEAVLAHSEADRGSLAAQLADRTICVGPAHASGSYLNIEALLCAAVGSGCDAVHPGYGFLSENAAFAQACVDNGLVFVGPTASNMRALGQKLPARRLAEGIGVPVVPGGAFASADDVEALAGRLGLPLLVKASSGGGGRGLRRVNHAAGLADALSEAAAEAHASFGDATLYVERFIERGRHIEVQVVGDTHGNVAHLYERDCTVQRRFQKLVEETPSPAIDGALRDEMTDSACRLAQRVGYVGVGTVEFIFDQDTGEYFFLEMNTRLQVEHPVTEMVTGVDLVALQLSVASGDVLPFRQEDVAPRGHALELRVNAEDPQRNFAPVAGRLTRWRPPAGPWVRVDSYVEQGARVLPFYDSLLAKLVVWGPTRAVALDRARRAVDELVVEGVPTTAPFHRWLIDQPDFASSAISTTWVDGHWTGTEGK